MIFASIMLRHIVDLGVAVMTSRNAVIRAGRDDLVELHFSVLLPRVDVSGLKIPAPAAATIVVGLVGGHVNEIFLTHNRLDHIAQVICGRITESFSDDVAGILDREFNLQVLVPVGTDLEFPLPDPLGVVLKDAGNFQVGLDFVFLQSFQDRISDMASLRIEIDLAPEILGLFDAGSGNMFPPLVIGQEHAVVFPAPSLGAVSPVCSGNM